MTPWEAVLLVALLVVLFLYWAQGQEVNALRHSLWATSTLLADIADKKATVKRNKEGEIRAEGIPQ